METIQLLTCKVCGKPRLKSRKFYCSRKCSNIDLGKKLKEQNLKNTLKSKVCKHCHVRKTLHEFSYEKRGGLINIAKKLDICKKCGGPIKEMARRERTWKDDSRLVLLNNAKQRCKAKGWECEITKEDIIIPDICPVLGIILKNEKRERWYCAPSLDRIDNTKGYVKNNIIVVSRRVNKLKNDATVDELVKIANFYQTLK